MTKLGQNFLTSKNIVEKIIKAADIKPTDVILETGPGKGILTEALLKKAKKVIAVEKDPLLVDFLKQKFSNAKNLELIHGDILKIDHWKLIENCKLKIKNFKIVANIPYYITSHFLRKFLEAENQPELMVLMVQKEVAERIIAKPPKMNLLALSVQVYGQPKIITKVSKNHFSPQPKVDSAIIKISNISRDFFNVRSSTSNSLEKRFFEIVKKGFAHKRKTLKNNLNLSKTEFLTKALKKRGLSEKARAQELSLEGWKSITGATFGTV